MNNRAFRYPPKPDRGDAIAVLSPSGRAASRFPAPFELGLARLRDEFDLIPVEYPTTRSAQASPLDRATDIHSAFADPKIKAVIASIGGEDELKVLAQLDPAVLKANPKPFFGYSDNTNLHLALWNLGLVSYYGGAVMVQLARPGAMHQATREALGRALFTHDTYRLEPPPEYTDEEGDWGAEQIATEPPMFPASTWSWHGPKRKVSGRSWGGCLEIIDMQLRTNRYVLPDEAYDGTILFLETSEELPSADYVSRLLMCMGERGLLQRFGGILWARPKAWSHAQPNPSHEKSLYTEGQKKVVLAAFDEYQLDVPLVFGVDFGHTEPQFILPCGGEITLDGEQHAIEVSY